MRSLVKTYWRKIPKFIPLLTLVIIFASFPIFYKEPLIFHILILANIYTIFSSSWDVVQGYAGQVSLGHALFFGGSAYLSAFFTVWYNFPQFFCIIASGAIMIGASLLVGAPSLRLKGPYLALATLAFSEAIRATLIAFPKITGGEEGFRTISMLGGIIYYYYFTLITMIASVICLYYIANRLLRLPLIALREDEEAAEASGINTAKYKLLAFMISAFFSAIAGGLYVYYMRVALPRMMSLDTQLIAVCSVVVGGVGTIIGPVIGAYIITMLSQLLSIFIPRGAVLAYAVITFLFVALLPKGIMGFLIKPRRSKH